MNLHRGFMPVSDFDYKNEADVRMLTQKSVHQCDQSHEHEYVPAAHEVIAQLRSRLMHSDRLNSLGQMAAGIIHDINTPTAYVRSNLQSLASCLEQINALLRLKKKLEEAGAKSFAPVDMLNPKIDDTSHEAEIQSLLETSEDILRDAMVGVDLVKDIVRNLNNLSRKDQEGKKTLELASCIDQVIKLFSRQIAGSISIHCDVMYKAKVLANEVELSQVFMNLIQNAIQAIKGKGHINIRIEKNGSNAQVVVTDTGCGMDEALAAQVFDEFFTTKHYGTGLGLSIVKDIIERHDGHIFFNSQPGEGSQFKILLPLTRG